MVLTGMEKDVINKNDNIVVFIFGRQIMPKVNEEYLVEKRKEILNAAFEVCKRKPAYDVTMSDVVAETGMSQGGVYKYFNNIYSVYAALIDDANQMGNQIGEIDKIMDSKAKPEVKLQKLFAVSESFFSDMLLSTIRFCSNWVPIAFKILNVIKRSMEKQRQNLFSHTWPIEWRSLSSRKRKQDISSPWFPCRI